MRLIPSATIAALVLVVVAAAQGQGPLDRLSNLNRVANKVLGVVDQVLAQVDPAAPASALGSGYLGMVADDTEPTGNGVMVKEVKAGMPAELGGLKNGDVVTSINDKPCRGLADLDAVLDQSVVGTKLKMIVIRAGQPQTLNITLGRKPIVAGANPGEAPPLADPLSLPAATPPASPAVPATPTPPAALAPSLELPAPPSLPATSTPAEAALPAPLDGGSTGRASLGVTVVPLTDEVRSRMGISTSIRRGAVITAIRPGGSADTAGLPLGGIIAQINGVRVETPEDLIGVIAASRVGQEVELSYWQGDKLTRKTVKLGPAVAVGIVPAVPDVPPTPAPTPTPTPSGTGPNMRRFENLLDPTTPIEPRTIVGSTILDPSKIKLLYERVQKLEDDNASLQERVRLLEAKLSDTPPALNPLPPLPAP